MASGSSTTGEDSLSCPICLEVFDKPTRIINCGHVYCERCLQPMLTLVEPSCPVCRKRFDPRRTVIDKTIQQQIVSAKKRCEGCSMQIRLSKMRSHANLCRGSKVTHKFEPVASTTQEVPKNLPNRSTFPCPYCGLKNLDTNGLVRHCNEQHAHSAAQVVCPVCASMPWGDPGQTSGNFLQHLNLRHKFEYDTYVDYQQDDEDMLRAAIQASMVEK